MRQRRRFFRKATDNKASNQQNDSFQKILDDYILYRGNIENIDHTENDDNMLYFDSILQDPCAFPLKLTLDFLKHITNDFSEEKVLGSGGFGVVYKGVLGNGKAVAVKRLKNVETNLSDEQYKKELRNIIGLQNKNIVQFKGYCADSSQVPWPVPQAQGRDQYVLAEIRERVLCFEYLPNKSLRQHISDPSCGLEWLVRYDIIKGICSGLHYLHTECDIAHMDLKPENILLDDNMVPKIGDFGTSRLFDENQSRIITSNCVGSLGYMSPEYLHRRMISKKADIFSFGVIILELLTGSKSDYPEREELFTQFTEDVARKWRNRLPDADYSRQVRTCISMALNCVDANRDRRPTTGDILKKLEEVHSRSPLQDLISLWSWVQNWMQKWVQKWMQKLVQVQKFGKIAIGVGAVVLMLLNPSCSWSWVVTALNSITLVVTLYAVGFPAVVVGLYMKNEFSSRPRDILFTIVGTILPAVVPSCGPLLRPQRAKVEALRCKIPRAYEPSPPTSPRSRRHRRLRRRRAPRPHPTPTSSRDSAANKRRRRRCGMAEPPLGCPSGALMALLTAMDARLAAGPSGSVMDVETYTPIEGHARVHGPAPQAVPVLHPVEANAPVPDPTEATRRVGPEDGFSTPKKAPIHFISPSSFVPDCDKKLKPVVEMSFDSLDELEIFYKTYAHTCGFSVRIGAQGKKNGVVQHKRFVCSREGFAKRRAKSKKQKMHMETRCGCNARVYVKLGQDNKYYIASFVEEHNHGLVSTDKIPFLGSNRTISQRAKTTLFTCHKASIGTSQAYRLLQVSDGFDNIGCMKRDLQNYYRGLREKIKSADAQLFVAQMERKKEANPAFFYDFAVDEHGKLVYIFWADATCRKNYSYFGDLVSVDATYSTNQYNMKFVPFTGVNHHMQSVFFGAAFLANEKIESYEWLLQTFLVSMGGKSPRLIITDEDASMKSAIKSILPDTIHRLCMWHIMEKFPEKVGPPASHDEEFRTALSTCIWASETPEEFEMQWNALIDAYGLQSNEWLANRYEIRESWIPAFFMDIALAGLLRTTSRSESANSFFNRFIHRKLCFVEFWLRFDTALECQRHEELKADHISIHSTPVLRTPWVVEKQASILYTYNVFRIFQEEVVAARDHCSVLGTTQEGAVKYVLVSDGSKKDRVVQWCTENSFGYCSCKLFEKMGILCRHILVALRGEKIYELPSSYILKRWETRCKRESVYDDEGNLLEEKPEDANEVEKRRKMAMVRNKIEEAIQRAKSSNEAMEFLVSSVLKIDDSLGHMVSSTVQPTEEEYENFIGCKILAEIQIHPLNDVRSKGRCKRIKRAKELPKSRKRKNAKKLMKEPSL